MRKGTGCCSAAVHGSGKRRSRTCCEVGNRDVAIGSSISVRFPLRAVIANILDSIQAISEIGIWRRIHGPLHSSLVQQREDGICRCAWGPFGVREKMRSITRIAGSAGVGCAGNRILTASQSSTVDRVVVGANTRVISCSRTAIRAWATATRPYTVNCIDW